MGSAKMLNDHHDHMATRTVADVVEEGGGRRMDQLWESFVMLLHARLPSHVKVFPSFSTTMRSRKPKVVLAPSRVLLGGRFTRSTRLSSFGIRVRDLILVLVLFCCSGVVVSGVIGGGWAVAELSGRRACKVQVLRTKEKEVGCVLWEKRVCKYGGKV